MIIAIQTMLNSPLKRRAASHKWILVFTFACVLSVSSATTSVSANTRNDAKAEIRSLAMDHAWSGHRIKPFLLTRGEHQFVAYFDSNRQMTVAHRKLGKVWDYFKVDSWLGWDSHNYVTMELDSNGYLHVTGNMHANPIEYFRMSEPYNVRSLKRIEVMVDRELERRVTYPIFMLNQAGELLLKYRDGGSGNGSEIYNIYDVDSKTWSRLHSNQFLDGEGKMSAYFEGPIYGPDGNFHLIWVWRNTPDASTNHSLSYARSPDLVSWEDSNGQAIELPLTLDKTEVVDPVPPKGGMINNNVKIGFDQKKRQVISYHKYDENGNTQMFVARKEGSEWRSVQISDWKDFRWDFGGGGSLGRFPIQPFAPEVIDEGTIGVLVRRDDNIIRFLLDANSLETLDTESAYLYPPEIESIAGESNRNIFASTELELELSVFKGRGDKGPKGEDYYLSWYGQPGNRDRAHVYISDPSVLLLHEVLHEISQ
ncbi:BNR repeat-containing protein [Ningiella sp. W23]|uniref:BNR repeat-containing protein n=1 Tax=Ningiella sp. W23 TaxID=3023715 RepID=UPI003756D48B